MNFKILNFYSLQAPVLSLLHHSR